ncbi:MAG: class I SAM-dependent DNA methyltransferase [Planctomycetes bacterium]|nr:class I SAM-dependent DNA methyltransferase [Planctomycetota bacterium]
MAIDITGITNENEFYTHHYLSAILENDLKDVFSNWKRREDEEDVQQPYALLRGLRKEFFFTYSLLERERKIEERLTIQRSFISQLLNALGYQYHYQIVELDDGGSIPLLGGTNKADGSPELWIIEAMTSHGDEADPLELTLHKEQYPPSDEEFKKVLDITFEEIITRQVFSRSEPPRWIVLVSLSQFLLLDRTKWNEKRHLRFDIREILDRRETSTLQAMAALLHRESICPKDGMPLLDTLDENSHKHAFAVSEDLKYSLRRAIELLGNEAVSYLRENLHEKIYSRDMAGQLTRECLRYMYRMLFLFYIEARPELGYLPDKSEEYRKGYSLESLRDLEMIQLTTDESKNGFYFHEAINTLFDLLYAGFQPKQMYLSGSPNYHTFRIAPLRSHLFDKKHTPLLNKVKLRNSVLQEIIELMSLSRPKKGKKSRRGRISYAQLGINQLGAVYEALLSYQGFFAEMDLYEVQKAGEKHNVLETAYFVKPEDLEQYTEDERIYNDDGTLVKYDKGTFIYRLAGRDREKSASYYTPEVLTKCLVKYALKELLKNKTADEILALTVCEPAMGSAAFLNEAVNQLAQAYLGLKQKEIGQTISHDAYPKQLQKVKMYIADNNVYGVDLNPVAVELAEVSLWLNTIYEGAFVPWFGMQLVCGNSLIGARRQVFHESLLKKKQRTGPLWLDEIPKRVIPGKERERDTVYHFLLPDKGMADYKDKIIKQMAADEIKTINEWRKEFTKPFSKTEINQLKKLSSAIDKLWKRHAQMQRNIDKRTTDPINVFGQEASISKPELTTTEEKDRIYQQEMFSKNVSNSSPYRRLKLVMDYWCALWFWPIEKADLLPSRTEFLFDLTLVLEGNLYDSKVNENGQQLMFPDTLPKQMSLSMLNEFGYVNVDKLCSENKRFGLVKELAERYRYLHWELEFADLFGSRRGFDLVVGNPPWIEVHWEEKGVLSDINPLMTVRDLSAAEVAELRTNVLSNHVNIAHYFSEYIESTAIKNYLTSSKNYEYIRGKNNLYKCFNCRSWDIIGSQGVVAFVNYEGIFSDPKAGGLRRECYYRLIYHFHFENELLFFKDVANAKKYEINIFSGLRSKISFDTICNLFHPRTIDESYGHPGIGAVPGIKNDKGWDLNGHRSRIVYISDEVLALFASIYEGKDIEKTETRLPVIQAKETLEVLRKFGNQTNRLRNLKRKYFKTPTTCWNEVTSEKQKIIKRHTVFPKEPLELIYSGPHFYVANPYAKAPREHCKSQRDYSPINLDALPEDYIPRANYIPALKKNDYVERISVVPWGNGKKVNEHYRLIFRSMIGPHAEKTLIGAIIPPGPTHINSGSSYLFESNTDLALFGAQCSSIVYDSYVKIIGKQNLHDTPLQLPIVDSHIDEMVARFLRLNCLTRFYEGLWSELWKNAYKNQRWTVSDDRLSVWESLAREWKYDTPLRNHYERRQALVEIDVLLSMALGLALSELQALYRIHCPVLRQYEKENYYDMKGNIVFTVNKGLSAVGVSRSEWNEIKSMNHGTVERITIDDTMPGGPIERTITYEAPFGRCDREMDYEVVWAEFERRAKEQEGKI